MIKIWKKVSKITYFDIAIITGIVSLFSFFLWLFFLIYSDLNLGDPAEVLAKDIETNIVISLVLWVVSTAFISAILALLKNKHTKKKK